MLTCFVLDYFLNILLKKSNDFPMLLNKQKGIQTFFQTVVNNGGEDFTKQLN